MKRIVDMGRELPGGRVRIHWFIFQEGGPVRTSVGKLKSSMGPMDVVGREGRIACDPKRTTLNPSRHGEVIKTFHHTDDPRAATCPECCATGEYKAAMAKMNEGEEKVKIHWFKRDEGKPARETGHIACEPDQSCNEIHADLKTLTDDPRAATCQQCRLTEEYSAAMIELDRLETIRSG